MVASSSNIDCSYGMDDSDNIRMTMVLGALIYTLDGIRLIARQHQSEDSFKGDQYDLVAGDYNFLDGNWYRSAQGKSTVLSTDEVPANLIDPENLRAILADELNKDLKNDDFTNRNIQVLEKLNKSSNIKVYVNNFNAVHNDTEVVYAITVLAKEKEGINQIAVVFRGSVYPRDWLHNLMAALVDIRIRIEDEDTAWLIEGCTFERIQINVELAKRLKKATGGTPIRVHKGFLQYLFAKQETDSMTKYDAIAKNLCNLMQHPHFNTKSELTITGHSLGGALATLVSFFLACDSNIMGDKLLRSSSRKYISCISFASPLVGDEGFQRAFAVLEKEVFEEEANETCPRLRHVRITNGRDFVPLLPPLPSYRHTGVQVHLRGKNWFGRQQVATIIDTGVSPNSSLWQFIGCMLTTFPMVILLPAYFLLRNTLVLFLLFIAFVVYMLRLLFFFLVKKEEGEKELEGKEKPAESSEKSKGEEKDPTEVDETTILLKKEEGEKKEEAGTEKPMKESKEEGQFLHFLREKILPLAAIFTLLYIAVSLSQDLAIFCEIMRTTSFPILNGGDGLILGSILLLQVIMLVRQPHHVYDSKSKDENGTEVGITHSLSFYDSNLTRAQDQRRGQNKVPTLKSSDEIWKHGARYRKKN